MTTGEAPRAAQMAVVLTESASDKLLPVATLVSGAVAMGMRVDIFASYWGLTAFLRANATAPATVSPGHGPEGLELEERLRAKKAPSWRALLEMARSIGEVHIYACSQSMDLLGLTKEQLDPMVESVSGVATFVDRTRDASVSYFV